MLLLPGKTLERASRVNRRGDLPGVERPDHSGSRFLAIARAAIKIEVILESEPIALCGTRCYIESMNAAWSNIEAVARDLCERQMRAAGTPIGVLSATVDRYWHCVAAEIEAGLIDEQGHRLRPYDGERDLEAYRDWRCRHRTYRVPA